MQIYSQKSLLIIDEFGKGTNSADGEALLTSVVNHLEARGAATPRTLICTHFLGISPVVSSAISYYKMDYYVMSEAEVNASRQRRVPSEADNEQFAVQSAQTVVAAAASGISFLYAY